ncbi:MAG TPA: hypothetical protein PKN74_02160 [Defluviitoga sp.]|nr:hypothetical protein [Defluviitoga sp.]
MAIEMPSSHEIQILLTKSVNVAENVQAISQSYDSAKNLLLVKQATEYSQTLHRKVKNKDRAEKKYLNNDLSRRATFSQRNVKDDSDNESVFKIDDYRGKILDLRL